MHSRTLNEGNTCVTRNQERWYNEKQQEANKQTKNYIVSRKFSYGKLIVSMNDSVCFEKGRHVFWYLIHFVYASSGQFSTSSFFIASMPKPYWKKKILKKMIVCMNEWNISLNHSVRYLNIMHTNLNHFLPFAITHTHSQINLLVNTNPTHQVFLFDFYSNCLEVQVILIEVLPPSKCNQCSKQF